MSQQMTNPELNSVHSVKILLCYLLDRLDRTVTEEQLRLIADESGVINYFYFSDAVEELIENGSFVSEKIKSAEGGITRSLTLTGKGRMGAEYFNRYIPLFFRKNLLHAALSFFIREENKVICRCSIADIDEGCRVVFTLKDRELSLMDMSFYAPDREQAELIAERVRENPSAAYKNILKYLLDNPSENIDVEKYL
ncbi:MAG: DUF4364 family protein [Ruminococcus sp.]|nr:DUF4364 family protein [Ruminococcus sp.]